MRKRVLVFAIAVPLAAGNGEPAPRGEEPSYRIDRVPPRLGASVESADAAIGALQRRLSARLLEEMTKGGPARAVAVCRDEAQALTAEIARAQGIRVGRTSHRLRNPGNAAPGWAAAFVEAGAGKKAAAVEATVVDLGDRVGVLRPIATAALCSQCHGRTDGLAPDVRAFLEANYPRDRAVAFTEGDLRGFVWAEVPTTRAATPPQAPLQQGVEDPARGRALFAEANPRCTLCHSLEGKGNPQGVPLDGVGRRLGRDEIRAWIRTPAEMAKKGSTPRKPAMVAYPEFSDDELDALVAFVSSLEPRPE